MPSKEIKELRQAGKLAEALNLAKTELNNEPDNIWSKRNISWVYYEYLKENSSAENFDKFIFWIIEVKNLELPNDEKLFFENLCWQVGKIIFSLIKHDHQDLSRITKLFELIQSFEFPKPSEGYSFLLKAIHKAFKDSDQYISYVNWWDLSNISDKDFRNEKLDNGREMMSLGEMVYINYAKHLLPRKVNLDFLIVDNFDEQKARNFINDLNRIIEQYPHLQYPIYYKAKLLLALGDIDQLLNELLPFVRKKRNDFWAWVLLAEAFLDDSEKLLACYCKALTCKSPEVMLIGLRQKMAKLFISREQFDEARTEIELLIHARTTNGYSIPGEVSNWLTTEWFKNASSHVTNDHFYKQFVLSAESLLYSDVEEELIFVDFVNHEKKIFNFITSKMGVGFAKYKFFNLKIDVGDVLKVRFEHYSKDGISKLFTAEKITDNIFKNKYIRNVSGLVRVQAGHSFGFIEDSYIHASILQKYNLIDGAHFNGISIISFNKKTNNWGWKMIDFKK